MKKKRMLLVCCAPCAAAAVENLSQQSEGSSVLFYNPNIDCVAEHNKRQDEVARLCAHFEVPFFALAYEPMIWSKAIAGFEDQPERGMRCAICFKLRIARAMDFARQNGFDTVSSVLGVSRYKNLNQVNQAAEECHTDGVMYDAVNWRKEGLQERAVEITQQLALYKQDYCGCLFSRRNSQSVDKNTQASVMGRK